MSYKIILNLRDYPFLGIILLNCWQKCPFQLIFCIYVERDKLFLHTVAMHSTHSSPTILVYDGAASVGQSMAELASYQGVPPTMVLTIDWKIEDKDHVR